MPGEESYYTGRSTDTTFGGICPAVLTVLVFPVTAGWIGLIFGVYVSRSEIVQMYTFRSIPVSNMDVRGDRLGFKKYLALENECH